MEKNKAQTEIERSVDRICKNLEYAGEIIEKKKEMYSPLLNAVERTEISLSSLKRHVRIATAVTTIVVSLASGIAILTLYAHLDSSEPSLYLNKTITSLDSIKKELDNLTTELESFKDYVSHANKSDSQQKDKK